MTNICYVKKSFRGKTLALIEQAVKLIAEYQAQGYDLTLRQLFYAHVSRNLLPNTERSYKLLGDVVNDGRLAGLIDWNSIVDRTRHVRENNHWSGPAEIVRACAQQFQINKWAGQKKRVIVLIEKDALIGVIEPVCRKLDTPCLSCRGYTSQTEMWNLGQRLLGWAQDRGATPVVLHLGDHDPSGIDMSRDIEERLQLFLNGVPFEFDRLALNMHQVKQYKPPPNPAKLTDSRCGGYTAKYGDKSWELDALEPKVLSELVRSNTLKHLDSKLYNQRVKEEEAHRATLSDAATEMEKGKD